MSNLKLDNALDHNLKPIKVEDESLPLNVSDSKIVYPKTPTDTYEVANKKYVDDNAGGGGVDTWVFQTGARWSTRYDNWFFPNQTYGFNFYLWSAHLSSSSLPSSWEDSKNPNIVVPKDITLKSYKARGSFTSVQTYELALLTGTPSYGSSGDTSLTQVGSTQSLSATSNIQNQMGEDGLSVSLSSGDILIPALRRTTTDTSSYYYFYMNFELIGEYA